MSPKFTIKPPASRKTTENLTLGSEQGNQLIFLGKLAESSPNPVWIDAESEHVTIIVGKRGSGKSYTLGVLVESLSAAKDNVISKEISGRGVVLLDTLDIFWPSLYPVGESETDEVKKQERALRSWKIEPVDINVEVWIPAGYRSDIMPLVFKDFHLDHRDMQAEDWSDLIGVDLMRDPMGQLLGVVYIESSSNDEGPDLASMLAVLETDEVSQDYARETIRALRQRLSYYSRHEVFSSGTKLNDFIKPGFLSVLLLNGLPDDLRSVVVSVLIRKVMRERSRCSLASKSLKLRPNLSQKEKAELKRVLEEGIPRVTIALDEAQNAVGRDRRTSATDLMVKLVREGRNFGTSLLLTTQQPGAIDERIMAQSDMILIHKLVMQGDISVVKKHLKSRAPDEIRSGYDELEFEELLRSLGVGQCVVSSTDASVSTNRTFVVDVRPRVSRHGGFED